ncbi:MAG: hypothetical protein IKP92_01680 [Lachnospiraceae bacterium]|nr:hypothetical protein [Lachnospiraceae bacterium]
MNSKILLVEDDDKIREITFVIVNNIYKEYAAAIKRPHIVYQNLSASM